MVNKALVIYGTSKPVSEDRINQMARFDLVDTDFAIAEDIQRIKALNPATKVIGYRSMLSMHTYYEDWAEVNTHEDWFLHDLNGNRLQIKWASAWFGMDISKVGWRNHFTSLVKQKVEAYGFDGVFLDNCWRGLFMNEWTVPASLVPTIDVNVWQANMRTFLNEIKTALGSKLAIYNGTDVYLDSLADGLCIEFITRSAFDMLVAAAQKNKYGIALAKAPYNPDTDEEALWAFCVFLISSGSKSFFAWQFYGTSVYQGYHPIMDTDVGNPRGAYYTINSDVLGRDFDHAKVFVNFSSTNSYTVTVDETEHSLPAHSGLIVPWEAPTPTPPIIPIIFIGGVLYLLTRRG